MSKLFKFLTKRISIKCNTIPMNYLSHRSYKRISKPLSSSLAKKIPILSSFHQKSYIAVHKRFYGNNNLSDLTERLRNGQITKSEVQRLINNQQYLNNQSNNNNSSAIQSMTDQSTTMDGKITTASTSGLPTIQTIGSKNNPLYMRRQTSFKEFIFSLFPFLFIFWMLGGFDMVKSRQKGGVGGMFGNNYSEWDEEDWEDDDDEMDDNDGDKLLNKKKKEEEERKRKLKEEIERKEKEEEDRRSAFFRKLGININKKDDKQDKNDKNKDPNASSTGLLQSKHKKKRKRVRFRDVCGNEEAKLDLKDLVDYLKNPEKYQVMGCKLPKGVLMAGPPGTGKTLLARALAGEAGVPFLATNGASFDEIFVGVGVMRVRKLFERAKERAPCIVFIDEIDAIANTRMQMGTAHSSDSLNALLSEMDGFEQNSGVIVIAATNMPDRLDAALIRPGRFDRKVHLSMPDKRARKEIVELYLGDRGDLTVNVVELVSDISGFSGAELESMVNLASIECVKEGKNAVTQKHLIEAKEIISMGRARTTLDVGIKTKTITAYHEGGHAIVSLYTCGSKPIYKATILPRGPALGFVASSNQDEFMMTKESLLAQLDVCMGGRAAEEIYSGNTHITTGASSDFNQATRIATLMVCQYGMSKKVGKVYYSLDDINKLSPQLQNIINEEVRRLLDESYYRAKNILIKHKKQWKLLANTLLDKETLSGDEIKALINYNEKQKIEPKDYIFSINLNDDNNSNDNNSNSNNNGRSNNNNNKNKNKNKNKYLKRKKQTQTTQTTHRQTNDNLKETLTQNGGLLKPETELLNPLNTTHLNSS